jgi:hypothetical protein
MTHDAACPQCGGQNIHRWTHDGQTVLGCACDIARVFALLGIPIIRKVTDDDNDFLKACGTAIE